MTDTKLNKRTLTCYACRESFEYDFYAIQKERTHYMYSVVRESKDKPRNYYLRCPHCRKFNRTRH